MAYLQKTNTNNIVVGNNGQYLSDTMSNLQQHAAYLAGGFTIVDVLPTPAYPMTYSLTIASGLTGKDAAGQNAALQLSGTIAITTTPLAANGAWLTAWLPRGQYIGAQTNIYSDAAGTYLIEYSDDGGATLSMPAIPVSYSPTQGTRKGAFDIGASFVRFTFTNGSVAQTKFKFEIRFLTTNAQYSVETLNAPGADSRFAAWNKSRIETKTSDATNDYAPIYRSGNALRVFVDNSPSAVDVSALAKESGGNLAAILTNLVAILSKLNGSINAEIANDTGNPIGVSAANLPLPLGASTEATLQSIFNRMIVAPSTAANQSTANSFLVNIDNDLGSPSDAAVVDPMQNGSVISLLKGLLQESIAAGTTGVAQDITLVANIAQTIPANTNRKGLIISSTNGTILIGVGFTATATRWSYRIVTNGVVEIPEHWAGLLISLLSTSAGTATATLIS